MCHVYLNNGEIYTDNVTLLIVQIGGINYRISGRLRVVFRKEHNATVHKASRWSGLSRVLRLCLLNLGGEWVSGFIFALVIFSCL